MERVITYNLNEDFIGNIAGFIHDNFLKQGRDISNFSFVFGGKRSVLFLKKELAKKTKKGFLSPRFFSVDEFIEYIISKKHPFIKISDLDACFIIYKLSLEIAPEILAGREGFSQFMPWAREIISFIDQLDLEDVGAGSLKNIQEKASIGYDVPENINHLLASIITIRKAYHQTLEKKNTYSRGLSYLLASRYIKEMDFREFERIFFCGLFYLHKVEQDIISYLYDTKKAMLFFQGDKSEWSVLDKISQNISCPISPREKQQPGYNLCIQSGFDVHSEVCLVREILRKIKKLNNTVIVLPQPENLIPLLSEISPLIEDLNISMGYPLKRSSLYSLFECVFTAQNTKKEGKYYTRDYLRALSHPLIKNLKVFFRPSLTRVLVHKIEEILLGIEKTTLGGSLYIKLSDLRNSRELYDLAMLTMKKMDMEVSRDELKESVLFLHNILFEIWEDTGNFYGFSLSLERFLNVLIEKSFLENYPLNLKMAEKVFSIKDELNNAAFNKEPFSKEEVFKIFENKLGGEMISFSGSPLKGLQILGLFETRCLSFENVIFMDVNESVLPNLRIYEPLIPREIMISLGLNRLEKEEEIQRYQFRRLIASAKNVYLIYQDRSDREKSRLIEELIWEAQKKTNSFDALSVPHAGFKVKVLPKSLEIKKDPKLIEFLGGYEYSSSSINTYMHCPLRFYYQYVLGLRQKEDLLEEPEGADIGNFIHELLEGAFAKFIGSRPYIGEEFKKEFFVSLDKKFAEDFEKKMRSDSFLIKEIIDFRMKRFLEHEKKRDVRGIICLEGTFRGKIKFSGRAFKFKAIIDRIDRLADGSILIIDYKTGNADIMPRLDTDKAEAPDFTREALRDSVKSFQLPLYVYLAANDGKYSDTKINACLYSIKDLSLNQLFKKGEEPADTAKLMDLYLKALGSIIKDILNPKIPFKADESEAYRCDNCPFFYLCR